VSIYSGIFYGTIGEDLPVEVEYEISGKHYPATLNSPEEFPDVEIKYVKSNDNNILECLNNSALIILIAEIDQELQGRGYE